MHAIYIYVISFHLFGDYKIEITNFLIFKVLGLGFEVFGLRCSFVFTTITILIFFFTVRFNF